MTPVRCPGCGDRLIIRSHFLVGMLDAALINVAVFGGLIAGFWYASWWPVILGFVLAWVVVPGGLAWLSPLVAASEADVARLRWKRNMSIGLFFLLAGLLVAVLRPLISAIATGDP